ncbi:homoaconitate hydratase [Methanofollis formosanus]|uniref:Homoaconitate hydratase n=1 Tax=Methanofollis formosanus TaxID=299308 RepID=A0A8G1A247_9EURY|nr:homocitrate synthase family protein [Methanofollis formosanus]QYZ79031.1 homoaconitate hydratase [Methanofollis formosanus]
MKKLHVEICDVTLRDGEQTPGVTFTREDKMEIASLLDATGVEVIEAGFPAVSAKEQEAVRAVCRMDLGARICALSRARKGDVDAALDCGVDMIGLFAATSDLHIRTKYKKSREEVMAETCAMIEYAHDHGVQVRFGAEDASRTDLKDLIDAYRQATEAGADLATFADTVGCMTPMETFERMQAIRREVDLPLCIHCHDDLGCATANTLVAAEAGAFQLHTTVNGLGERAGNTPLEEVLVVLATKAGINRYDLSQIGALSDLVARTSGVEVARNKAVVGANAFAHESGIHIAALLEDPSTYEYYRPALVGRERTFVLGKHTGRHAIEHVAASLGYHLNDEGVRWVLHEVKRRSEAKCNVTPEVLRDLLCTAVRGREVRG